MPLIKGKSKNTFQKNLKTEMHEGKPMKQSLAIAYAMKRKGKAHGGMMGYDDGGSVIGENIKSAAKEAFKTPPSKMAKSPSGVPSTSDSGYSDDEAAKRQAIRKSFGYSKGGQVHNPSALMDERSIMDEIDREDMLTGEGYYLKESPFKKEHVASNSSAMHEENKNLNQHMVDMNASTDTHTEDLVDRIMDKRSKDFSQDARLAMGGEVMGTPYQDDEDDLVNRIMKKRHGDNNDFSNLDRYSEGGRVANQEHGPNNNDLAGFAPNEFDDLVLRDDLESTYGDDDNSGDDLGNAQEDHDREDIVSRIMRSRKKKDRMPNPA